MVRGVKHQDLCCMPGCRRPLYIYHKGQPYCEKCDIKRSDDMTKAFEEGHREEIAVNKAKLEALKSL